MTHPTGYGFPSDLRLRNRREFLRVRERGKKFHTPHFLILVMERNDGPTRLGITCSRKVGGAVERNRVKRFLREFFRQNNCHLPEHADISVIAKRGAHLLDYRRTASELDLLRRIASR
jgi:ribonuclease P protein component